MKKKVLFIEVEEYYANLGIATKSCEYDYEFNGLKHYKIKDEKLKKYHAVVSTLYSNPLSNFLIYKAKKNGIMTILFSDGIYDFANSYKSKNLRKDNVEFYDPIIHDTFFCVGDLENILFRNQGVKTIKFLPKRTMSHKSKIIELPQKEKVLITTANNAYFDEIEKVQLVNLLKKVVLELKELKIDYIFRIFDEHLINELNIHSNENFNSGTFEEVLKKITSVITTPSSITLTSMYHKRSVGQLIYRDTPLLVQSGWNISLAYPIKLTLKSLIKNESERISFQDNILKNYIVDKNPDELFKESLACIDNRKMEIFINKNLKNIIDSKYNFNIENLARKIYSVLKKIKK